MATNEGKRIPIKEGLWTTPSTPGEEPQLIGSKCPACGEIYFPKKPKDRCVHCQHQGLEDIKLSRRGKIHTCSMVTQRPPKFYLGEMPYAYGCVDLPEGVRVETSFTGDLESLKPSMDVELVIEKLGKDDEGN